MEDQDPKIMAEKERKNRVARPVYPFRLGHQTLVAAEG